MLATVNDTTFWLPRTIAAWREDGEAANIGAGAATPALIVKVLFESLSSYRLLSASVKAIK